MIKFINLFFFLLVFSFSSSIIAQKSEIDSTVNKKTKSIYFKSSALFKCSIKFPVNYNPEKKYILVLGLHGGGSNIERFISIWDSVKNTEFIYAVSQAPYPWLVNKKLVYDWALWPSGKDELIKRASNLVVKYIGDLTAFLKKRYNVSDVYLLGFSQGAIFTYLAGIRNYKIYKGLIILSGPGLLEPLVSPFTGKAENNWLEKKYIRSAKSLRIFIAHGKDDKMAKYELGVKSKDVLSNFGYDVTFRNFIGGHSVNNKMLELVNEWVKK